MSEERGKERGVWWGGGQWNLVIKGLNLEEPQCHLPQGQSASSLTWDGAQSFPLRKHWTSRSPSGHNPVNPSLHLSEPLRGQCHETSWTVLALGELPLITATRNVTSLGPETLLNLHQTPLPWITSFSTTWGAHYQPTASWKGKPQIPQRMMMAGDMGRKTTHPNLGQ